MLKKSLTCAIAFACTAFASAYAQDLKPGKDTIKSRDGSSIQVEYGTIEVPENRSVNGSRMITLAYMHVTSPLKKAGTTVFPLAGGPGGDAIGSTKNALQGGGQRYLKWMGGDIVAIDQRGTGLSRPNLMATAKYPHVLEEPTDPGREVTKMQEFSRKEAAKWKAKGVDLAGYTTAESADDIDAVRRKLGLEKISLWGGSYGTHLAMATIRRYPEHIDRAVLIGPEGPDHTIKLPSYSQTGLERIAKLVAADKQLSKSIPDFMALVKEVLTTLEKKPAIVEIEGKRVGVSKFNVQQILANAIGSDPRMIAEVPLALLKMKNGDYKEIARELLESRDGTMKYSAMQMVMDSASGLSKERAARIEKEKKTCLLSDAVNAPFPHLAKAWGAPDLGDAFRAPLKSDVHVLFIVGDLDSRTPIRNAKELMQHLPNSHLIVVENAAHGVRWNERKLATAWSGFLAGTKPSMTKLTGPAIRFKLPSGMEPSAPSGAVMISEKELAACVGEYKFSNGMTLKVRAGKGRLIATIPGRGDFNLWPKSAVNYFADAAPIPPLTFVKDADGKVTKLTDGRIDAPRVK